MKELRRGRNPRYTQGHFQKRLTSLNLLPGSIGDTACDANKARAVGLEQNFLPGSVGDTACDASKASAVGLEQTLNFTRRDIFRRD